MPLFDSDFLQKLEYLSLVSRRVFRGQLLAQRRTKQLGGGVEFADHRDYAPGDDFRYLDWNVYARHGDLLLKRFQEEEDLHVYLLLDCSGSMAYGKPKKFDLARQLVAALAYIALADLDRVSILTFAEKLGEVFPLTRGKERILALLRFLESLEPRQETTSLSNSVGDFIHRRHRTGLAIVVSDLFDSAGFQRGIDMLRHRHYEPHVIQLYDRSEADPKLRGDVELVDCETELAKNVTVSERSLRQYRDVFQQFLESVKRYAQGYGLGCTQSTTEIPFDDLVLRMMRLAGAVT